MLHWNTIGQNDFRQWKKLSSYQVQPIIGCQWPKRVDFFLQRLVLCPTTNHQWAPAPPAKSTNPIKLSYEFCCHLPMWAELPVSNIVLNNCQTAANLTHKLLISWPIIHGDFQTSISLKDPTNHMIRYRLKLLETAFSEITFSLIIFLPQIFSCPSSSIHT